MSMNRGQQLLQEASMHDIKVADVTNKLSHATSQVNHFTTMGETVASIGLALLAKGCKL